MRKRDFEALSPEEQDQHRAKHRAYQAANRGRHVAANRRWRAKNLAHWAAYMADWRQSDRGQRVEARRLIRKERNRLARRISASEARISELESLL